MKTILLIIFSLLLPACATTQPDPRPIGFGPLPPEIKPFQPSPEVLRLEDEIIRAADNDPRTRSAQSLPRPSWTK